MESVEAGSICDVVGVVERVENWQVGLGEGRRARAVMCAALHLGLVVISAQ